MNCHHFKYDNLAKSRPIQSYTVFHNNLPTIYQMIVSNTHSISSNLKTALIFFKFEIFVSISMILFNLKNNIKYFTEKCVNIFQDLLIDAKRI